MAGCDRATVVLCNNAKIMFCQTSAETSRETAGAEAWNIGNGLTHALDGMTDKTPIKPDIVSDEDYYLVICGQLCSDRRHHRVLIGRITNHIF